ncbi:MAG: hypothetical protein ACI8RZ_000150 [Myxococcota bacterium]|jgi:hypothetical protein
MDRYGPRGFQAIDILIENNNSNAPTQGDLAQWANNAGMLTVPVLNDGNYTNWAQYEQDFYIPTTIHIGPDMTVLSVDQGITDPGQFVP